MAQRTLHADATLAAAIEASVTRDLRAYAEACAELDPSLPVSMERLAGGLALYVAPGSPVNMVFGAGFDGPVTPADLDEVEAFYAARDTRAAISLSPLADESLAALLGVRGWMLTDFENVLVRVLPGRALGAAAAAEALSLPVPAPGLAVRVAATPSDRALWADISAAGFAAPQQASGEIARLGAAAAARDDMALLIASVDGVDAGAGALWVDGELAWMLGDATRPQLRRRGAQSALLAARTRLAAESGCSLAVTEAGPGSTSQRNMERLGYAVVYTRVELIAPPPRR